MKKDKSYNDTYIHKNHLLKGGDVQEIRKSLDISWSRFFLLEH